ncbi:uncharacterized protein A4U43_C05F33200 [Asparagus officinalis]|uniref:Uncharacterized protein n=1 Tax=Asparagus officinalis TaxID=4686 RepID=A0A5P1EWB6_ASPOF|nr:uncharacterized protein A4U43_C05F33200 [Asparagus officinalis]
MDFESSSSSLKHKIRSSVCFSCCFSSSVADDPPPSLIRSSSTWIRSKAHDLPEIKVRRFQSDLRKGRPTSRVHSVLVRPAMRLLSDKASLTHGVE